jgi:hypothetical protein
MMEEFVELDPREYEGYTDDGYPELQPPEHLAHLFGDGDGVCARGNRCAGLTDRGPAIVGMWLDEDDDRPSGGGLVWATCWYPATAPDLIFCEDCHFEITDTDRPGSVPYESTVICGSTLVDLDWFIDLTEGDSLHPFWAWVGRFAPDHGLDWEHEIGVFESIAAARAAVDAYIAEAEAAADRAEAEIDAALTGGP